MGTEWVEKHGGHKAQNIRARTANYATLKQAGRALRGSVDNGDPFYIAPELLANLPPSDTEIARTNRRLLYDNASKIHISLPSAFALSQAWRCAWKKNVIQESEDPGVRGKDGFWFDCDVSYKGNDQVNLMGYSVRSKDFRYTAYFHFDRKLQVPIWELPPASEELYDHRDDTSADLGHKELVNIAKRPGFEELANSMKTNLIKYLRHHVKYRSELKEGH